MEIEITNDGKEKENSFEATATFNYEWDNPWLGYGGGMDITAFGRTEEEAKTRLRNELFRYQSKFVEELSKLVF